MGEIADYYRDAGQEWLESNNFIDPDLAELHKCKNGSVVCINGEHPHYPKMGNGHLLNTIKWIERKADEGLTIRYGGGSCAEDMWYDEDTIYDDRAKREMNYTIYVKEAKKRKLKW